MADGVEALAGFVGAEGGADKVAVRVGQRGEEFFQPKDLVWLDCCERAQE
ncbi:hypothetical protein [Sinorhizobium meliloti]|nr:hypothetical protein [Sinorhizobium meliloti]CCM67447.1 hypothetical protein BN406_01402 [Sinorhizobium meliloti Rm41]